MGVRGVHPLLNQCPCGPNKCLAGTQVVKSQPLSRRCSNNTGSQVGGREGRRGPARRAPTQPLQGIRASATSTRVRTRCRRGRRAAAGGKRGLTSVFLHTPPLIIIRGILAAGCLGKWPRGAPEKQQRRCGHETRRLHFLQARPSAIKSPAQAQGGGRGSK